ncbi:MAG: hypothetical protein R3F59_14675 [Myxococcota bacterium]
MLALLLVTAAQADDIVFTSFALSADDGVSLQYALSPASAQAVAEASRMGIVPRIAVQFAAGGMDRTSHVDLKEPQRTLSLASGDWPPGMTATVTLAQGAGALDRLKLPQGGGTSVRVGVAGGRAGAQPLGMAPVTQTNTARQGSSARITVAPPAPPAPVDPGQVLAAAQATADQLAAAQRMAEEQARIAEEQRRIAEEQARIRAYVQGIFDDPSHPVHAACAAGLSGGPFEDCVNIAAFRDDGAAEVTACAALEAPGMRMSCVESLKKRPIGAAAAITACTEGFGAGEDGLRCSNLVAEAPADPSATIRACAAGFEDRKQALECVGRFREQGGGGTDVVGACSASFTGKAATECLALARTLEDAGGIGACAEAFDEKNALECIIRVRPVARAAAALVPACTALFPDAKGQLQCLERARRDPNAERVSACAEVPEKKRQRCVEGD